MVSPQIYKTAFQNILFSEDTKEAGRHSEQGTDVGSELLGFSLLTRSGVQLQTEKKITTIISMWENVVLLQFRNISNYRCLN